MIEVFKIMGLDEIKLAYFFPLYDLTRPHIQVIYEAA